MSITVLSRSSRAEFRKSTVREAVHSIAKSIYGWWFVATTSNCAWSSHCQRLIVLWYLWVSVGDHRTMQQLSQFSRCDDHTCCHVYKRLAAFISNLCFLPLLSCCTLYITIQRRLRRSIPATSSHHHHLNLTWYVLNSTLSSSQWTLPPSKIRPLLQKTKIGKYILYIMLITSLLSWSFRSGSSNSSSSSYTKHLERQIIRAWKRITRVTRKQHRYSFLPDDFVLVTARKRRSVLFR